LCQYRFKISWVGQPPASLLQNRTKVFGIEQLTNKRRTTVLVGGKKIPVKTCLPGLAAGD
jgi:hypothetical protein